MCVCVQGAHSPGARVLSMGVYPIQAIKSQILDQSDVSVWFCFSSRDIYDFQLEISIVLNLWEPWMKSNILEAFKSIGNLQLLDIL